MYQGEKPKRGKTWDEINDEVLVKHGLSTTSPAAKHVVNWIVLTFLSAYLGFVFYDMIKIAGVLCFCTAFLCAIRLLFHIANAIDWLRKATKLFDEVGKAHREEVAKYTKAQKKYEREFEQALIDHCSRHHLTLEIPTIGKRYRYYPSQRDFVFRVYKCRPEFAKNKSFY